jgi:hypothetical protein
VKPAHATKILFQGKSPSFSFEAAEFALSEMPTSKGIHTTRLWSTPPW